MFTFQMTNCFHFGLRASSVAVAHLILVRRNAMADDDIKPLLERLCSLQEQQLAKLTEALDQSVAARERLEKVSDGWNSFRETLEKAQKDQAKRAVGYQIGSWVRTLLIVFMLGVIAIAIIIAHYLK
jgi:hypothetical protein